jgi:hypothetical protein
MQDNLFSKIFKYTATISKTPLENYCTEIFVYIFRKLIGKKDKMAYEILRLFGFNDMSDKDLESIKIITQKKYYAESRSVIPDITINLHNNNNIIEVKVNSGLRRYRIKTRTIDQIELYKKITDIKINEVFLLSKYSAFSGSLNKENNVLWSQIHSILTKSENEVIKNYLLFLEENGMKSSIVEEGAENAISSISAILSLIEDSWTDNKYKLGKCEIERDYFGYYLDNKNNKSVAWIGQLSEMKDYIVFEPLEDAKMIKNAKEIFEKKNAVIEMDSYGCYIFSKIKIEDITCHRNNKEQIEVLQKWINDEINIIL